MNILRGYVECGRRRRRIGKPLHVKGGPGSESGSPPAAGSRRGRSPRRKASPQEPYFTVRMDAFPRRHKTRDGVITICSCKREEREIFAAEENCGKMKEPFPAIKKNLYGAGSGAAVARTSPPPPGEASSTNYTLSARDRKCRTACTAGFPGNGTSFAGIEANFPTTATAITRSI